MKIGIIGYGVVGSAVAASYDEVDNCEVEIYDPQLGFENEVRGCDAVFICVPSPSNTDGSCDTTMLEQSLEMLAEYPNVIISKTTATPDVYVQLQKKYPNLVHCPEFLTQRFAKEDYVNGKLLVLGGSDWWTTKAHAVIKAAVFHSSVFKTDIATASLFKYVVNSYLALKVVAMNQYHSLAEANNVNWATISKMLQADDRIGNTHLQVPGPDGEYGFGGMCFPKDISALLAMAERQSVNMDLLTQAVNINNTLRE